MRLSESIVVSWESANGNFLFRDKQDSMNPTLDLSVHKVNMNVVLEAK